VQRRRALQVAVFALPALLTLYLGFNGGGFFAGEPARVAVLMAILLVLRLTLAERPFDGLSPLLLVAGGALGLFAIWALVSVAWSDAPGRALVEFDRARPTTGRTTGLHAQPARGSLPLREAGLHDYEGPHKMEKAGQGGPPSHRMMSCNA
jgi:hypothetical protein